MGRWRSIGSPLHSCAERDHTDRLSPSISSLLEMDLLETLRRQDTDERQIAVTPLIIKAVADHEGVRHLKTPILDGDLDLPPGSFIEEHADAQRRRTMVLQMTTESL